ncbi:hypothetical protein FB451DRAFT_1453366 [Mycena latifolia]|nr:hypothetical protein FB451DRAFT_1453366 [Mycena latifolia]
MPLINNSTGFQIHGGAFYEVSGDVNLETHQHLLIQDHTRHDAGLRLPVGSTLTLEEGSDAGSRRELSSAVRNPRHEIVGSLGPGGLSSPPHLGSRATVEERLQLSSSSISLRQSKEFGTEFNRSTTFPSITAGLSGSQPPHAADDRHSNDSANFTSFSTPPRQDHYEVPSWDTVQSASDFARGPQGTHYRGAPVSTESQSEDHLAHFTADPSHTVHGGTFITAQNINHRHGETGIHILHRAVALEALYDSAESFPQPRCHPETRTSMLDNLYSWAIEENTTYSIYWLHGPAGAGKSAITQTLCRRLQDGGQFSGSFFFKRSHTTRGNAKALFMTLAYQLALHHPELKGPISKRVEGDPSVLGRGMDVQLSKLIIEPLTDLTNSPSMTLLIDGLDECKGHDVQQEILCLLGSAVCQSPMLRILIASRPEPQISQIFKEPGMVGLCHLLNIGPAFMDIRNYLLSEFSRIHHEHEETMASVPTPWPTRDILEELVDKSSGYFIYAATIIKFIDDRDFRPTVRLAAVIKNLPTECGTPFHALDKLYSQILRDVPFQSHLLDILCAIVHGSELKLSTKNIEKLLGLDPGDVKLTLRHLQSLLLVPQDETHIISLHHKSFHDFLLDPNRSGKFHIGLKQYKDLACSILRALSHSPVNKALPTFVAWDIGSLGLEYITSKIPPSVDLLPLIQTINFDFLWRWRSPDLSHPAKKLIQWLKVSRELASMTLIHLIQEMFTPT